MIVAEEITKISQVKGIEPLKFEVGLVLVFSLAKVSILFIWILILSIFIKSFVLASTNLL